MQRRRIRAPHLLKTKGTAKPSLRKVLGWIVDGASHRQRVKWRAAAASEHARDDRDLET